MIENFLNAFSSMALKESLVVYKHLKKSGHTMDDLAQYLEELVEEIRVEKGEVQEEKRNRWEKVAPECPECGDALDKPRRLCGKEKASNKEGWSCQWFCIKGWNEDEPSEICGWEKYTHENALEITRDLMRGNLNGYNIP